MRTVLCAALFALVALALSASAVAATTAGQPFPTNLDTVVDTSQATSLRVNLPKPDCSARPTDCADVDVLNMLDGFNIQPRISIPFSGPIDTSTVSSSTVFLIGPDQHKVGINQAVWEPATNTLHVESDEQLAEQSTYLLVVTQGIKDAAGNPIDGTRFRHDLNFGQTKDPEVKAYRALLLGGLFAVRAAGLKSADVAALSLFTTQSIIPISRKVRAQIQSSTPSAPSFNLGTAGERTVFPLSSISAIQWRRQIGTAPAFANLALPVPALSLVSGSVGTVAFGSYASPNYETAARVIPAWSTRTGVPEPQGTNTIGFTLFLPSGTAPAGGWPVAIFGHGFGDSRGGAPWAVASMLASKGLASIAINVVGHGGGALGTYTVLRTGAPAVTLPDGGRGIDQDGNGSIDSTEGVSAVGVNALVGTRDGLRQTVFDLMQLVRQLEAGVDVDGNGAADLSTSRIYYAGQSFGGIYGVQILGLEPLLRAGVPNVPGGPIIEIARLSPAFRPLVGIALLTRMPSLHNVAPPTLTNFIENIPLRNEPLRVDMVPGASAIQELIDNTEWVQQSGNPAAYAPYVAAPMILQFARGDQTVPNPTTSAIIRAGDLASSTTLYRHDLAWATNPVATAKNPHTFLTGVASAFFAPYALAAQNQIATFFASDGATVIDPDGTGPFFETPTSMVPEDTAFIP